MRLVPGRKHRFWSVQLALLWGGMSGLYAAWGAFQDVLPAWLFASSSAAMCAAITVARVVKQPGVE